MAAGLPKGTYITQIDNGEGTGDSWRKLHPTYVLTRCSNIVPLIRLAFKSSWKTSTFTQKKSKLPNGPNGWLDHVTFERIGVAKRPSAASPSNFKSEIQPKATQYQG